MHITALSKASGLTPRTIHKYTSSQLVRPPYGRTNNAMYGPDHLADLRRVAQEKRRGLSLDEIAAQVPWRVSAAKPSLGTDGFSMKELCAATDMKAQAVRNFASAGVLGPPSGRTSAARYGADHLTRLKEIKRLLDEGCRFAEVVERMTRVSTTTKPTHSTRILHLRDLAHLARTSGVESRHIKRYASQRFLVLPTKVYTLPSALADLLLAQVRLVHLLAQTGLPRHAIASYLAGDHQATAGTPTMHLSHPPTMRVPQLAAASGLSIPTVRKYIALRVLREPPEKHLFDQSHIARLLDIRRGQMLGFALAEIASAFREQGLLATPSSPFRARNGD